MANRVTRTMRERTAEVTFMSKDFQVIKRDVVIHGNKINYADIANELSVEQSYICEVDITDKFVEYKTYMEIADFLRYATICNSDKRIPGYFYRTIKATVYTYKAWDITNKKPVDIQTSKSLKIGKVYDNQKIIALVNQAETDTMYRMSDTMWQAFSVIEK